MNTCISEHVDNLRVARLNAKEFGGEERGEEPK